MENEKWLTVKEVADKIGCSKPTVYEMLKNGLVHKKQKIKGVRLRKIMLYSDVVKFRNLGVRDV